MRGAPLGNKNAAKGKQWSAALERSLERRITGKPAPADVSDLIRGLDAAADLFTEEMFVKKDLAYFKEFGDRMEGKSSQSAEVSIEHSGAVSHHVHRASEESIARVRDLLGDGQMGDTATLLPH